MTTVEDRRATWANAWRLALAFNIAFAALIAWQFYSHDLTTAALPDASQLTIYLFNKGVFAIFVLALIITTGTAALAGFRRPARLHTIWIGGPILALTLLLGASISQTGIVLSPLEIVGWMSVAVLVSIGEEVIFRGLLFELLAPLGVWVTALLTSFGFGAVHLLGLFGDYAPQVIFAQAFFAMSVGLVFAAMRFKAASIWTVLILHAVFDAVAVISAGGISEIVNVDNDAVTKFLTGGAVILVWGLIAIFFIARPQKQRIASDQPL